MARNSIEAVRLKIAALWTSAMFCYVYGDYFGLYVKGKLADMEIGSMGPLGAASPGVLTGVSVMMAVPALMISLALLLPRALCRWLNMVLGVVYAALVAMTLPGAEPFYIFFTLIEMALTIGIAVLAFRWSAEP